MEKISPHQFMLLSAGVLLGTTFFPVAETVAGVAGRDGWMSVLPGFALAIPLGLIVFSLIKKFPGLDFLQITEKLLGKWFGKALGLFFTAFSVYFGAMLLNQVEDTFKRTVLPLVPGLIFMGGIILLVVIMAWEGMEVFARFSEIVFPITALGLIFNVLLIYPRIEWEEFLPVLADGIKPVLMGSLKIAPYACEYIVFLVMLLPFLHRDKDQLAKMRGGLWRAVLLVGCLNTLVSLAEILVFGPVETKRLNYGLLSLGKLVEIARTISGVESIFMLIWMGAMLTKVAAFYFLGMFGLQRVFGIKDKIIWYLLLAAIFLAIGSSFKNGPQLVSELIIVDDYVLLPFTILWVITIWGVAHFKKGAKKNAQG